MTDCEEIQVLLAHLVSGLMSVHEDGCRDAAEVGLPNPGVRVIMIATIPCEKEDHPFHFVLTGDVEGPALEAVLVAALNAVRTGRTLPVPEAKA